MPLPSLRVMITVSELESRQAVISVSETGKIKTPSLWKYRRGCEACGRGEFLMSAGKLTLSTTDHDQKKIGGWWARQLFLCKTWNRSNAGPIAIDGRSLEAMKVNARLSNYWPVRTPFQPSEQKRQMGQGWTEIIRYQRQKRILSRWAESLKVHTADFPGSITLWQSLQGKFIVLWRPEISLTNLSNDVSGSSI